MHLLAEDSKYRYYLLEEPYDVDHFSVIDFDFFKLYGIVDYKETFKIWLRKFPRPIFITAVSEGEIIGFIYIDSWEEMPDVVNVLRAQETHQNFRHRKIGYKLFVLGLFLSPSFMITKPLTKEAEHFYQKLGFEKIENTALFSRFHSLTGYMILPLEKKEMHLNNFANYFEKVYL